jgi:iron complex outermembrane receptor protein
MSRNQNLARAVRRALVLGAASTAAFVQPIHAAEEGTIQEVIVTGSRIAQPGLTSVSPVIAVGSDQIKIEGVTRVEDLINNLPQAFADFGGNVSNGATGAATVNLRNLGRQRTLVLVNSRRLMPGDPTQNGAASPDLNQIPAALIERVEVLTGGASAVYGADAVAGVVNFIMNDNFEGVRVDAQYSMYQHNQHNHAIADLVQARDFALPDSNVTDGNTTDITFVAGINTPDGRGNATVYIGYRELDAIKQDQRDFSACSLGSSSSSGAPGPFTCSGSSTSAAGRFITRSDSPFGEFDSTIGPDNRLRDFAATDQFNFAPDNFYQRPDERKTAGLFAHYDFSEKASVYTEFMFMDDRSLAQVASSGAFIGSGPGQPPFFGDQLINCDNPLLTPDELAAWCGGNPAAGDIFLSIGRRNVEGGPRIDDLRHTSFRGVVGLRGDISDGWTYDIYGLYGTSILSENFQNDLSVSRVGKALNAVVDSRPGSATQGQTVCRVNADADFSNDDPACVPWNIFQAGGVTPAQLAYVHIPGVMEGSTTEQVLSGSISADLGRYGLKLPTATDGLAFAFGAEYRSERSELRPDASYQANDLFGQGAPTLPTTGGFDVKEVFAELRVPILQDKPLAQVLSLETGYRYSDYNLGFDTDSYKLGLNWAPADSVRLRGSYQRAVRSPNVQELFLQPRVQLNGTSDPCAGDLTNATTADDPSATFEQCVNSGVTAAQYGRILVNPAGQYNGRVGGSPDLDPEESDTYSYGFVLTPSFLPEFSLSVDYYDIKVEKLIGQVGQDFIIGQCLEGVTEFCSAVNRVSLNGSLWLGSTGFINDPIINTGSLQTKGIDAQANYHFAVGGAGRLALTLIGTYTDAYTVEPLPGAPTYDCAGLYGTVCGTPIPEWRHKLRASWQTPWGLDLSLTWRHIDKVAVDGSNPDTGAQPVIFTDRELGARDYLDLSASYTFTDVGVFSGLTSRLGINNVTDKDPPLFGASNCRGAFCNGNTFPQVYDTLGRYVFVGLTADF